MPLKVNIIFLKNHNNSEVFYMYLRLRDLREDAELNQKTLARYLNVHQTTYSDYELGNINIPIPALIKLADFYNTSIDYLVGRTDQKEFFYNKPSKK